MKRPFSSVIMMRLNFKVKRTFLLQNWGACVDTRFWHVLMRRVAKEKRLCIVRSVDLEGDRVPRSKILLTEEGEVDQIFWLRIGKNYLIFRIFFYSLR